MGGYSSEHWNNGWHERRHHGNFWVPALIIFGLIILTHGWILFLPLMIVAAVAFFGFIGFGLPRLMWYMHEGGWQDRDWSAWAEAKRHRREERWQRWQQRHGWYDDSVGDKPKRNNPDDIEYV